MKNFPKINLKEYDYELPKDRIAFKPLDRRSDSKLLVADASNKSIIHTRFNSIIDYIPSNSSIYINTTRVICARLFAYKPTGGKIEILCVEPIRPSQEPAITLSATTECTWKCIIGGRNIKPRMVLSISVNEINLQAEIIEKTENEALIRFSWQPTTKSFAEILDIFGVVPLPPYIKRDAESVDKFRYQTVFAKYDGSIAAPTAGLHFTDEIIQKLKKRNVEFNNLVLHVGPGTFQPIESDLVSEHNMHSERIYISLNLLKGLYNAITENKHIIATGTTSLRTLESIYWLGVKTAIHKDFDLAQAFLKQSEPYDLNLEHNISVKKSISSLLEKMKQDNLDTISAQTQLFIVPSYKFKIVDSLITNYHLPKSTLILLVAAFIGKDFWQSIYNSAIENDYRFLSYGDSSLLLNTIAKG